MKEDFITGKLPETVTIDGAEYPIRSDFRVGMLFDRIWGSGMDERDKVIQLLGMYYPRIPANVPEAVSRMLWFYRCGEPEEREEDGRKLVGISTDSCHEIARPAHKWWETEVKG